MLSNLDTFDIFDYEVLLALGGRPRPMSLSGIKSISRPDSGAATLLPLSPAGLFSLAGCLAFFKDAALFIYLCFLSIYHSSSSVGSRSPESAFGGGGWGTFTASLTTVFFFTSWSILPRILLYFSA